MARAAAVSHKANDVRIRKMASDEDDGSVMIPEALSNSNPIDGEIGKLKQQMQAIEDATIQSQCEIEFRSTKP